MGSETLKKEVVLKESREPKKLTDATQRIASLMKFSRPMILKSKTKDDRKNYRFII